MCEHERLRFRNRHVEVLGAVPDMRGEPCADLKSLYGAMGLRRAWKQRRLPEAEILKHILPVLDIPVLLVRAASPSPFRLKVGEEPE